MAANYSYFRLNCRQFWQVEESADKDILSRMIAFVGQIDFLGYENYK